MHFFREEHVSLQKRVKKISLYLKITQPYDSHCLDPEIQNKKPFFTALYCRHVFRNFFRNEIYGLFVLVSGLFRSNFLEVFWRFFKLEDVERIFNSKIRDFKGVFHKILQQKHGNIVINGLRDKFSFDNVFDWSLTTNGY